MVLRDDASCAYETKEMAILARGCLIGKKSPLRVREERASVRLVSP